jgi:tetratricopeptide (TPR) repeat protein
LAEKSGIAISNVPIKVIGVEDKKARLLMLGLAQQHAGNVAADQESTQECQRELEKTAPDSSPGPEVHAWLGHAYAGLGDAASAIREGQKAMAIDPTSSDPFEGPLSEESMAEIYAMLGDADHAIPILEKWIQVPSFTEITPSKCESAPSGIRSQ